MSSAVSRWDREKFTAWCVRHAVFIVSMFVISDASLNYATTCRNLPLNHPLIAMPHMLRALSFVAIPAAVAGRVDAPRNRVAAYLTALVIAFLYAWATHFATLSLCSP